MLDNNFKKGISLAVVMAMTTMGVSIAAPNYNYQSQQPTQYNSYYYPSQTQTYNQNSTLKGRVVTVPAGATLSTVVTTPLSSATMTVGQCVTLALASDFYHNGSLIAPAGSTVMGTVIEARKATHGTVNGKLAVRFTEITTPYGGRIPIAASIKTSDGTGVLKGGTAKDSSKEYAKDIAGGAAAGALTGLVASAIAGGAVGKGTAIMTGVGAGAGLLKSGWDKGADVTIPSNSRIDIQIDQPITVSPMSNNYDY